MGFWKRILGASPESPTEAATARTAPPPPPTTAAHIPVDALDEMEFFLDLAKNQILDDSRRERWVQVFPDIDGTLALFIERGWLREATIAEHLQWFPIPDLKNLLRQAGAKVSGRKPELASRLAAILSPEHAASIVAHRRLYAPTDLGAEMLVKREAERLSQRKELEDRLMTLLVSGDVSGACDTAGCESMERRITLILSQDFRDALVADELRARIGPALAISELLGEGTRKTGQRLIDACAGAFSCPDLELWLSTTPSGGYASDVDPSDMRGVAELYGHTKLFTASNLERWQEARDGGWSAVEILSTDDCPVCARGKRIFRGGELNGKPPVPRHWGCRCLVQIHVA